MAQKVITGNTCSTAMSSMVYIEDKAIFEECLANLTRKIKCDYLYIFHKGEGGDKNHIHLLLRPLSAKGFTNVPNIRNYFIIDNEEKSRCTNFVQSKSLGDWYNYAYHNKEYLDKKKETKEYYYSDTDIIGSEDLRQLCLEQYKYTLDVANESELATVLEGLENGLSDFEICQRLHLCDVGDYVQALRLIDEAKKRIEKDMQLTFRFYDVFENILGQNPTFNNVLMSDLKMKSETISCAYVTDKYGFSHKDPKMYDFFVNKANKNSKVMKLADVVLNYISTMDFMELFEN